MTKCKKRIFTVGVVLVLALSLPAMALAGSATGSWATWGNGTYSYSGCSVIETSSSGSSGTAAASQKTKSSLSSIAKENAAGLARLYRANGSLYKTVGWIYNYRQVQRNEAFTITASVSSLSIGTGWHSYGCSMGRTGSSSWQQVISPKTSTIYI